MLYWDEKEKKYKGYVYDLLERISIKSIFKFEFVFVYGWDVEDMLCYGKVDFIFSFNMIYVDDWYFIYIGRYMDI